MRAKRKENCSRWTTFVESSKISNVEEVKEIPSGFISAKSARKTFGVSWKVQLDFLISIIEILRLVE